MVSELAKAKDFSEEQARSLFLQVQSKDYNLPKREKILPYQQEQEFPNIPNPDDPDQGKACRDLNFPDHVYQHISKYYEYKAEAARAA